MSQTTDKRFPLKKPLILGLGALLILVGGFGTWAATTNISGAIVAGGQIQVERNRQVVQHPDGGVVQEILVDEGDTVEEGEVLVKLDPTLLQSELNIVEGQYFELVARRARLQAERDNADELAFDETLLKVAEYDDEVEDLIEGQRNLFFARLESLQRESDQLAKRRDQIVNQVEGIDAQQ
ncbi:biotin/lipoyl-binding protein, partial [Salipiger sp. PrR003]